MVRLDDKFRQGGLECELLHGAYVRGRAFRSADDPRLLKNDRRNLRLDLGVGHGPVGEHHEFVIAECLLFQALR